MSLLDPMFPVRGVVRIKNATTARLCENKEMEPKLVSEGSKKSWKGKDGTN